MVIHGVIAISVEASSKVRTWLLIRRTGVGWVRVMRANGKGKEWREWPPLECDDDRRSNVSVESMLA